MENYNQPVLAGNVSAADVNEHIAATENRGKTQQSASTFNEKNYLDLKLAPGEESRTVRIRILPVSATDGNFCVAIQTHSLKLSKRIAKSGFKSFVCLKDKSNENQSCPLCEKSRELFAEAKRLRSEGKEEMSKTIYKEACSYMPKETYIVRVIERGKESEGVKFWRFNANSQHKGYHDDLVALYRNRRDEYEQVGRPGYNIFDLQNGRDVILTLNRTVKANGTEGVAIKVDLSGIETPLSADIEQANAWINDPKKWQDAYAVKDPEYLKIIADGLIPVRDKATRQYVGRTEDYFRQFEEKKKEEEVGANVLASTATTEPPTINLERQSTSDMDLPF